VAGGLSLRRGGAQHGNAKEASTQAKVVASLATLRLHSVVLFNARHLLSAQNIPRWLAG